MSSAARVDITNVTKTLAFEWDLYNGIRINRVAPSLIISSGMKNCNPDIDDLLAIGHWMNPMSRYGTESDISTAVAFSLLHVVANIIGMNLEVAGHSSLNKGHPERHGLVYSREGSLVPANVG
ncbi:hypothetical protein BGZ92_004619 [Podila epicladia]|nr:hypothetical protein BGZ92_004619 [Podila epicladia]